MNIVQLREERITHEIMQKTGLVGVLFKVASCPQKKEAR